MTVQVKIIIGLVAALLISVHFHVGAYQTHKEAMNICVETIRQRDLDKEAALQDANEWVDRHCECY